MASPSRVVALAATRRRIAGTVALVLLIGVAGGAVLSAAAGARRTASAYPRLLERSGASDLTIISDGSVRARDLEGLPGVTHAADAIGFGFAAEGSHPGIPDMDNGPSSIASGDGHVLFTDNRPLLLDGRRPDPSAEDEVLLNERAAALYDVAPGDRKRFYLFGFDELNAALATIPDPSAVTPEQLAAALHGVLTPIDLTVVGIGRLPSEVVANENQLGPAMILTSAFARAHADTAGYRITHVDLQHPRHDLAGLQASIIAAHPDSQLQFQTREALVATVADAVRPYHDALVLFSLIGGLTSLVVVSQALARQVIADGETGLVLGGLGMTRAQVALACAGRAGAAALGGATLAAFLAFATSPLFPIGPASRAEPGRTLRFDAPVVIGGAVAMAVLLGLAVAFTGWRQTRLAPAGAALPTRRPMLARLERAHAGSPAAIGIRMGLSPSDPTARATRTSTILGLTVALATIVAAMSFGASLDRLVSTPGEYGWTWDSLFDTYDNGVAPEVTRSLGDDEAISSYTVGARASLAVDGQTTAGFGFDPQRGSLLPTVTAGRFPAAPDEVALGAAAMRRLHTSIGSHVQIGPGRGEANRFTVVGQVVLPSLNLDDTYGLADGAALTLEGLTAVAPAAQPSFVLVDFAPSAGRDAIAAANRRHSTLGGTFLGLQRPGDIASYSGVRRTPLVLAGLLALLGFGVLVHGLLTSLRVNRRSLAVLTTIGFIRRQVRSTVGWHVTATVLAAAVLAVPLGIAGGRWAWSVLVDRLGIPADPIVPVLALAGFLLATLVVAGLVGTVPARRAAHTHPAVILRSE